MTRKDQLQPLQRKGGKPPSKSQNGRDGSANESGGVPRKRRIVDWGLM